MSPLGFDKSRLYDRVSFLLSRAFTPPHELGNTDPVLEDVRIATLLRDAAMLLMMLDEYGEARVRLDEAGQLLVRRGLLGGYFLLLLSRGDGYAPFGEEPAVTQSISDALNRTADDSSAGPRTEPESLLTGSLTSVRQLMWLFYTLHIGRGDTETRLRLLELVRARLTEHPATRVGATDTTVLTYLTLFDTLAGLGPWDNLTRQRFLGLMYRRRELLEAEQADSYHWTRLLRPEAIVDLDLVALCLAAYNSESEGRSDILATIADFGELGGLPRSVADGLRGGWARGG